MNLGELVAGQCAGQTFIARAGGLYRLDVWLATYQRINHGPLVLRVRAAPWAADWVAVELDMADVADNAYQSFTFAPLPLPAGVPGYFCLEAPAASTGNAVTIGGNSAEAYPGGRALLASGHAVPGMQDMRFQAYYQPGSFLASAEVLRRLAENKPSLFGEPRLYAALIGLVSLQLGGLGWAVGRLLVVPPPAPEPVPAPEPRAP